MLADRFEANDDAAGRRVFQARDRETMRDVTVTELTAGRTCTTDDLQRFEASVDALALVEHPNIPRIVDGFAVHESGHARFYLAQATPNGRPLDELVAEKGPFAAERVFEIVRGLLYAVAALGNASLVHGDIKPANVLYSGDQTLSLTGFGALSTPGTIVGTAGYTAPEQRAGRLTHQADLYSIGMTAIFLISGLRPADLRYHEHRPEWPRNVEAPPRLRDAILRLVEPAPADRFADAREAVSALPPRLMEAPTQALVRAGAPAATPIRLDETEGRMVIDFPARSPVLLFGAGDLLVDVAIIGMVTAMTGLFLGEVAPTKALGGALVALVFTSATVLASKFQSLGPASRLVLDADEGFSYLPESPGALERRGSFAEIVGVESEGDVAERRLVLRLAVGSVTVASDVTGGELAWLRKEVSNFIARQR